MSEDSLSRWFKGLQPLELVEVLRDFLGAEANRVDGSTGDVHFSTAIYTPDGGVDGRTSLPTSARALFLPGPRTWQVKSGQDAGVDDIDKPGTQEALGQGRDYVLCWTGADPITRAVDDLVEVLRRKVKEKHPDRTADVITIPDLVRMAAAFPSVVQRHNGPSLMGLSLEAWGRTLKTDDYPFVADPQREMLLDSLRRFVGSADPQLTHIHVVGDTGVGKSRLVYHALDMPGLRATVMVAPEYQFVNLESLKHAALPEGSYLVLVVDDVTAAQIESLRTVSSAVAGRLRLITIGDRGGARYVRASPTRLDLAPLAAESMRQLLAVQGLGDEAVALVESMAQGYPRLAVELGRALREVEARSMADLLATADVHNLLQRMIPDENLRESLSVLALFDRVGVDGELATELDAVAHHFGVDRLRLKTAVRDEEGRFISTAGRYRRVTPLALAVWLVREYIRSKPSAIVDAITTLPESLAEAFRRQLEILGGDPTIETVLEEVASRQAGRFRHANGQLTSEGASFLHALSFAAPELAARLMNEYLGSVDEADLRAQASDVRRNLVWGLSHLLWFADTFNTALDLLFRLAIAETETFSNNATGEFVGAFQLQLGGTEVPYQERLNWWDGATAGAGQTALMLLTDALAAGLEERELRMGGWRGARLQPEEWKPQTVADAVKARKAVWDRLLELGRANDPVLTTKVAEIASRHVRDVVHYPFMRQVLDELISLRLSPGQRATLADGLRNALRFDADNITEDARTMLQRYVEQLLGQDRASRLLTILATPPWDLDDRSYEREPEALVSLADELIAENKTHARDELWTAIQSPEAHSQTRYMLGLILGGRDEARAFESLIEDPLTPMDFSAGYLRGMSAWNSNRVEEILDSWLSAEKFDAVLSATSSLQATPLRAGRAVDAAIAAVRARNRASGLQRLAFGSWLAPLPPEEAIRVIEQLADEAERIDDFTAIDAALFAAETYIGRQETLDVGLLALGQRIVILSMRDYVGPGRDLTYLRNRLADHVRFSPQDRLELTLRALAKERFAGGEDLVALRAVLPDVGEEAIQQLFQWLIRQPFGIELYLRDASLVSILAEIFGDALVAEKIAQLPQVDQRKLLAHLDWSDEVPAPARSLIAADDALRAEVTRHFLYPGQVVRGPYSVYLASRRELIARLALADPNSKVQSWARELLPVMDDMIAEEQLREAEQE